MCHITGRCSSGRIVIRCRFDLSIGRHRCNNVRRFVLPIGRHRHRCRRNVRRFVLPVCDRSDVSRDYIPNSVSTASDIFCTRVRGCGNVFERTSATTVTFVGSNPRITTGQVPDCKDLKYHQESSQQHRPRHYSLTSRLHCHRGGRQPHVSRRVSRGRVKSGRFVRRQSHLPTGNRRRGQGRGDSMIVCHGVVMWRKSGRQHPLYSGRGVGWGEKPLRL